MGKILKNALIFQNSYRQRSIFVSIVHSFASRYVYFYVTVVGDKNSLEVGKNLSDYFSLALILRISKAWNPWYFKKGFTS